VSDDQTPPPTDANGEPVSAFSPSVLRYGREEALPERRELRAGPLTAVLEGGDLRHVLLAGEPVVLRLYGAVRDRNWGTVEPRFTRYEVEEQEDGFRVSYTAECVEGDVDFVWKGELRGTAEGVITAVFDGEARKPFLRNRIGWCVLHPLAAAGQPVETDTPDGPVTGAFPSAISPHQPFFDMQSISHPTANGGRVTIRFAGDLFEMEDQRNWTDASFKTYSTPLRIPYPVEVRPGERITQTVTIEGQAPAGYAVSPAAAATASVSVLVGPEAVATMPPIGLGAASHGKPLTENDLARLSAMHLGHLRLDLVLAKEGWREKLALVAREAAALGVPLEIAADAGDAGEEIDDLFKALADGAVPLARVLVFPTTGWTTTEPVLSAARRARDAAGIGAPVGGGSRTFFTEFNRAQETMPLAAMEVVGFPIVPTVHAIDNGSVMETTLAQSANVESAKLIAPGKPVVVGPIALRMPFNPNATGPEPEPAPGQLPPTVDERQPSLFAAAWTVASVGALSRAGVAALTCFQTNGWRGVMEREDHPLRVPGFHSWPGMTFPVYHVLADVAQFSGGDVLPVDVSDPLAVAAAAVRLDGRVRVLVANLQDQPQRLSLTLPIRGDLTLRRLDESTMMAAAADPVAFRAASETIAHSYGTVDLDLSPYANLTLEGQASD
jgi:hypothetical protein